MLRHPLTFLCGNFVKKQSFLENAHWILHIFSRSILTKFSQWNVNEVVQILLDPTRVTCAEKLHINNARKRAFTPAPKRKNSIRLQEGFLAELATITKNLTHTETEANGLLNANQVYVVSWKRNSSKKQTNNCSTVMYFLLMNRKDWA